MDKKLTIWSVAGFVMLYFVAVFAAEFVGFLHPVCWVLAPLWGRCWPPSSCSLRRDCGLPNV